MLDFHDDAAASYYEFTDDACTPANRIKFSAVGAGTCNSGIQGAFGNAANVPLMWKWATTRLSLADGVKGPLIEVFNGNHFCGYTKPTYYIEYPAEPKESCILNLTHALVDPVDPSALRATPVTLHNRHYFTVSCLEDKISMVVNKYKNQGGTRDTWRSGSAITSGLGLLTTDFRAVGHGHPARCLQAANATSYTTQVCQTDKRDSWRAALFGCGSVTASSDASKRV